MSSSNKQRVHKKKRVDKRKKLDCDDACGHCGWRFADDKDPKKMKVGLNAQTVKNGFTRHVRRIMVFWMTVCSRVDPALRILKKQLYFAMLCCVLNFFFVCRPAHIGLHVTVSPIVCANTLETNQLL